MPSDNQLATEDGPWFDRWSYKGCFRMSGVSECLMHQLLWRTLSACWRDRVVGRVCNISCKSTLQFVVTSYKLRLVTSCWTGYVVAAVMRLHKNIQCKMLHNRLRNFCGIHRPLGAPCLVVGSR